MIGAIEILVFLLKVVAVLIAVCWLPLQLARWKHGWWNNKKKRLSAIKRSIVWVGGMTFVGFLIVAESSYRPKPGPTVSTLQQRVEVGAKVESQPPEPTWEQAQEINRQQNETTRENWSD